MQNTDNSTRPKVTVVVTSYKRFDLLKKTLESFVAHNSYPIEQIIIIEDSDDAGVKAVLPDLGDVPLRLIINGENKGQIAPVDEAYRYVASNYIFHLEDDWEFTCCGFIEKAVEILEAEPSVLLVTVRDHSHMPRYVQSLKTRNTKNAEYKRSFPELHFLWHTFTFNPTLKRTAESRTLAGGYASIGDEASLSRNYKAQNRDMAGLQGGGARHIGNERSNYGSGWGYRRTAGAFSFSRFLGAENLHKWNQSLRRRFWHSLRRLGLNTEPLQRRSEA